jgi:nucleotide-binding universal stress UspA family protein
VRILVAIDDELSAQTAFDYLQNNGLLKGNDLKFLHVVQPSFVDGPLEGYPAYMAELQDAEREAANAGLKRLCDRIDGAAQSLESEVQFGPCAPAIADECRRWKADVAVAATHGRTGLSRFWFGSMAAEIAAAVPCSVVVLRMQQRPSSKNVA